MCFSPITRTDRSMIASHAALRSRRKKPEWGCGFVMDVKGEGGMDRGRGKVFLLLPGWESINHAGGKSAGCLSARARRGVMEREQVGLEFSNCNFVCIPCNL